jgi:hypothetical protein
MFRETGICFGNDPLDFLTASKVLAPREESQTSMAFVLGMLLQKLQLAYGSSFRAHSAERGDNS